jgi:phosphohistidine phosphatase
MKIYLVRHADAVPMGTAGIEQDEDRTLSAEGSRQTEWLGTFFQALDLPPDKIVTSPLVRCRQTAEGIRQLLPAPQPEIIECEALAPGGATKKLSRSLRRLGLESVILVGHEPDLGHHTAWLIGSKRAQIEFAKGGAACVVSDNTLNKGSGTLLWLVTPRWLSAWSGTSRPPSAGQEPEKPAASMT